MNNGSNANTGSPLVSLFEVKRIVVPRVSTPGRTIRHGSSYDVSDHGGKLVFSTNT